MSLTCSSIGNTIIWLPITFICKENHVNFKVTRHFRIGSVIILLARIVKMYCFKVHNKIIMVCCFSFFWPIIVTD